MTFIIFGEDKDNKCKFMCAEKQRMLDTKTWTTHYHFLYALMPDRYGE